MITGAGGAAGIGFTRSLRSAPEPFYLIGVDADAFHLQRAETDESYLVPRCAEQDYLPVIRSIAQDAGAEIIYVSTDAEAFCISRGRSILTDAGLRVFLPEHTTVEVCQDKYRSYLRWRDAELRVPNTILLKGPPDLATAFDSLGPRVWLRAIRGGAGKGSFSAARLEQAREWIEYQDGWGRFVACEHLSAASVTWQAIWRNGALIAAQGRQRIYWEFGDRAPSGVTGLTGTGLTVSDPTVDRIAQEATLAIDPLPDGIFGVDMTYDENGVPNPTEINIGRFFTTHLFFTKAGLNMPYVFVRLALDEPLDFRPPLLNPLPAGLVWIRGMDSEPILTELSAVHAAEVALETRRKRL